jgi:glucose-6-phosphate isomerase
MSSYESNPSFHATYHLGQYQSAIDAKVADLNQHDFTTRFWQKDATLWTQDAEAQQSVRSFMGWLDSPKVMRERVAEITKFVHEVKEAGFQHVVVMGMGGSTMAPIVFQHCFNWGQGDLPLSILDTTDPGTVAELEKELPLRHTLFIVASKSGTTAEPLAFGDYFYAKLKELKGDMAGENFVAITDPGSKFVDQAKKEGYRHIFLNFAEVGGRFSALTYFGLVPAACYGVNISALLDGAIGMMKDCGADGPVADNPGLHLGAAIGYLATQGRDKLTLITPDKLSSLGLWLEQLLAESTGKHGKGILPVAGEPLGRPDEYSADRVFVYVGYDDFTDNDNLDKLQALEQAGHPVILIRMREPMDLGREFYRWEIAVAVAGIVLAINPFDQPNVQESKLATDRVMKAVTEQGHAPDAGQPAASQDGVSYYADVTGKNGFAPDATGVLRAFFGQARVGDYLSLQAYLHETDKVSAQLAEFRQQVQDALRIATTSGYGPRFLHSTGQYHKGGPNTGLFVQFTADHPQDLPLPGRSYTFGTFENAQAQGDFETLLKYERRALHIHLGANPEAGLQAVLGALKSALAQTEQGA